MSLKAELETWAAALKAYDEEDFDRALQLFSTIADSSKILTNMGLIYATIGEHEAAVEQFMAATQLDQFLAVAYFQCGVSNFLLQRYNLAFNDFDGALLHLRGNENINYEQLGLKFKLYSAEVLFNKGLCQIYMGQLEAGLQIMDEARREKVTTEHNVIDDAITDRGDGYTVFSIPVGILYRPSENKLKNAKTKDYLGKAKLVAASDENEAYTTFTGVTRLKQGLMEGGEPSAALNRSVTVAVTSRPTVPDEDRPQPTLQRAKTTINVPADARERIRGMNSGGNSPVSGPSSPARGPGEGPASAPRAMPPPAGPARGMSMRRPTGPPPPPLGMMSAPTPPGPASGSRPSPQSGGARADANMRVTEIYDDYMDSYGGIEEVPPLPGKEQPRSADRVANWARNNANPGASPSMQRSRSVAPPSSYAPSAAGTLRRKTTRRTNRAPRSTYYEEEEEGYASGDYDDGPFEMTKIRVKIHYQDDTRGMAVDAALPFEDFIDRITTKFGRSFDGLGMKFKDEDGGKVTLRDEMDYELAIETARESAKGKPEGKLEIWCTDI